MSNQDFTAALYGSWATPGPTRLKRITPYLRPQPVTARRSYRILVRRRRRLAHPPAPRQVIARVRRAPLDATAGSGTQLAALLKSPVAKAVEAVIPFGSTIAGIVASLAPILDLSMSASPCAPGTPAWPECQIGSSTLLAAGVTKAGVQTIVEAVRASGGAYGAGRGPSISMTRTLRE